MEMQNAAASKVASRPDTRTAKIVETGIELITSRGRVEAANFLRQNGISLKVVARVISEPHKRRCHAVDYAYSGVTFQYSRGARN